MNDIRKGKIIIFEDEPYLVTEAQFLRKQQRRPVMRTALKHVRTGRVREHSFQQSDKIAEADMERRPAQFLYSEGEGQYVFMEDETYEQVTLGEEAVGAALPYLIEGQTADILFFAGDPLTVELPIKIERKIIEAAPGVKGDTSSNVMKEAVAEGGLRVKVPLFVAEGETIRIDTRTGEYADRAQY